MAFSFNEINICSARNFMYLGPEEKAAVPEMIWNFKTLAIQWTFLKEGDFLKILYENK